ncbi:MAG TPA: response regulator transcription factor [Solirubrobacteraceae bacterium]|nr:response regulator transcription factor [Solirubrobacteraceae bacterium]
MGPKPEHPGSQSGEGSRRAVAIVEDHVATRRFLADNLAADGYLPLGVGTLAEARALIAQRAPAAAIIDLVLPDGDGLQLVGELRAQAAADQPTAILVLSGRATEVDRLRGFDRGCDDYIVKPFSYVELRARLGALLRRAERVRSGGRLRVGPLEIDRRTHGVHVDGRHVHLSRKELALLEALAGDPYRVFTRDELLRDVWGFATPVRTRTVDTHASRLRRKLGGEGSGLIANVWGVGYRLLGGEPS